MLGSRNKTDAKKSTSTCLVFNKLLNARWPQINAQNVYNFPLKSCNVWVRHYSANVRVLAQTWEARDLLTVFSTWWHSPEGYPYSQTICGCSKWNHLRLWISIAAFLSPVSSQDTSSTVVFITIHWLVQAYMPWAYKSLLSPSFQLKHLYLFK